MKYIPKISLPLTLVVLSLGLMSQTVQKKTAKAEEGQEKKPNITSYLGHSDLHSGMIRKRVFDSLLSKGITARDSSGNAYKVSSFMFGYKERNLYEDSVGNLMVLVDYINEFCDGDTLSAALKNNILYDRTKPGDTAYMDQIKVILPNGKQGLAKSMKFYITK